MNIAHFVLNAVSERPYTNGRRIARERVISRSRSYRRLVLCNKIKRKHSKEIRDNQMLLRKRKLLPMMCQTTAWTKINSEQEIISVYANSVFDDMNKPYQVTLYKLDNCLNTADLATSRK